jgi:hypothetical protein
MQTQANINLVLSYHLYTDQLFIFSISQDIIHFCPEARAINTFQQIKFPKSGHQFKGNESLIAIKTAIKKICNKICRRHAKFLRADIINNVNTEKSVYYTI